MPVFLSVVPLLAAAALAVPVTPHSALHERDLEPVAGREIPSAPVPSAVAQSPANDDLPVEEDATPVAVAPDEVNQPGEILVTGRAPSPIDPAEKLNAVSYEAVQAIDSAIIGPVTHAYQGGVPTPVRDGFRNLLNNLDEPIVFVNFLLQLKPGKAIETLGRFAVNSSLGVGGLFDVAKKKPFYLPRRSNGLADTLGYYGVGTGPYLFLPLIGATTLRDLVARPFDLAILPAIFPKPFATSKVSLGKSTLSALDEREENDKKLARLHSALDPYVAQREEYLARRRAEIDVLKGKRKNIYDPPYYDLPKLSSNDEFRQEPDLKAGRAPAAPSRPPQKNEAAPALAKALSE